jgi:hypothetical protein
MNKFFTYPVEVKEILPTKLCITCNEIKPIEDYHKHPSGKGYIRKECKVCVNQKNRIKLQKIYDNPERLERLKQQKRNHFLKNKDKAEFRVNHGIRKLIIAGFKRVDKDRKIIRKSEKTESILGCSVVFFVEHIKKQLTGNMTMENYGKVWVLGHIVPHGYSLDNPDKIKLLNHYTNYAPQYKLENGELNCKIWMDKFTEYHQTKYKTIIEDFKQYQLSSISNGMYQNK